MLWGVPKMFGPSAEIEASQSNEPKKKNVCLKCRENPVKNHDLFHLRVMFRFECLFYRIPCIFIVEPIQLSAGP